MYFTYNISLYRLLNIDIVIVKMISIILADNRFDGFTLYPYEFWVILRNKSKILNARIINLHNWLKIYLMPIGPSEELLENGISLEILPLHRLTVSQKEYPVMKYVRWV